MTALIDAVAADLAAAWAATDTWTTQPAPDFHATAHAALGGAS